MKTIIIETDDEDKINEVIQLFIDARIVFHQGNKTYIRHNKH